MPLRSLSWKDEEQVVGWFKAFLAKIHCPLPKLVPLDGQLMTPFTGLEPRDVKLVTSDELERFAEGASPDEFFSMLATSGASTSLYFLLRQFGVWPNGAGWFKYHSQLRRIRRHVEAIGDRPIRAHVHAAWNGEDAFSIGVYLAALCVASNVTIEASDFIPPQAMNLQWLHSSMIPNELGPHLHHFFDKQTTDTFSLRSDFLSLVCLSAVDLLREDAFSLGTDLIVINGVLGQTITRYRDLKKIIEGALEALLPGGLLLIDNSAFAIEHPEFVKDLYSVLADIPLVYREGTDLERGQLYLAPML